MLKYRRQTVSSPCAAILFLELNGYRSTASEEEAAEAVSALRFGESSTVWIGGGQLGPSVNKRISANFCPWTCLGETGMAQSCSQYGTEVPYTKVFRPK